MLPVERVLRIKERIHEEKTLKISELSKEFGVSEMTIHRDVKPLIEDGLLIKTFGGISLAQSSPFENQNVCIYCSGSIHEKMAYRLILSNHIIEKACCGHCGLLRHRQLGSEVTQAICYDFFRQTTIPVQQAYFIMDTSVDMGCCQPQVLTFEREKHAHQFVNGFGGHVYSFQEAMQVVYNKMDRAHENSYNE